MLSRARRLLDSAVRERSDVVDERRASRRMPRRHALQPGKSFSQPQETPKVSSVMLAEQCDTSNVS